MKIGIMSDLHLGERRFRRTVGQQNMFKTQNYKCFCEAIDLLKAEDVEAVLVAGDVFDLPNPDVDAIIQAKRLFEFDVPVYVMGGNHDHSKLAEAHGYHCFDVLERDGEGHVHFVYHYRSVELVDKAGERKAMLHVVPYGEMLPETWESVYMTKNGDLPSVLMVHGYLDTKGNAEDTLYALPKSVAMNHDLVVCGHIHLPMLRKAGKTVILTPGSLMPSQAGLGVDGDIYPSVWVWDTETKGMERKKLSNSPKMYGLHTDDINKTLEAIANGDYGIPDPIFSIWYDGEMSDVDEYVYKKALQNSLSLSIATRSMNLDDKHEQHVDDFWDFVKKEHPEYYEEFQEIVKER